MSARDERAGASSLAQTQRVVISARTPHTCAARWRNAIDERDEERVNF